MCGQMYAAEGVNFEGQSEDHYCHLNLITHPIKDCRFVKVLSESHVVFQKDVNIIFPDEFIYCDMYYVLSFETSKNIHG